MRISFLFLKKQLRRNLPENLNLKTNLAVKKWNYFHSPFKKKLLLVMIKFVLIFQLVFIPFSYFHFLCFSCYCLINCLAWAAHWSRKTLPLPSIFLSSASSSAVFIFAICSKVFMPCVFSFSTNFGPTPLIVDKSL